MGDSEFETFFFALKLLGKQFYEKVSLINSILNKNNNEYCSILRKMSIIKKKFLLITVMVAFAYI